MTISTMNEQVGGMGGLGGMGGVGGFGLIGLVGLLGGGLLGGNAGANDGFATRTLEQTIGLTQSINASKDAILAGQAVGVQGLNSTIQTQSLQIGAALSAGFGNTQTRFDVIGTNLTNGLNGIENSILESKYDNAIQMCGLKSEILASQNAGTQRILDAMSCQTIKDLERQLAVAENGGPIVRAGTFVQADPCHTNGQISNINQVLVQVGNGLVGLQNAVAALSK